MDPPIAKCLAAGLITALQALLGAGQTAGAPSDAGASLVGSVSEEERLECLWIVTNVAAGSSHADTLATLAVSPYVIGLLRSDSGLLAEHAAWAVGNIAGDSQEAREALTRQGAVHPLCDLTRSRHHATARTACWAVTNLMRGPGPAAPFVSAGAAAGAMKWFQSLTAAAEAELLGTPQSASSNAAASTVKRDDELLTEAAWVLTYITAKEEQFSHELAAAGVMQTAVRALALPGVLSAITPCLRILGNVGSLSDSYIEAALGMLSTSNDASSNTSVRSSLLASLARILAPSSEGERWLAQNQRIQQQQQQRGNGLATSGDGVGDADEDEDGMTDDSSSSALPSSSSVSASAAHYTHGHVQEALWVLSNIAGSTPAAAAMLMCAPSDTSSNSVSSGTAAELHARLLCSTASLPPHALHALGSGGTSVVVDVSDPGAAGLRLGFLPLLVHHATAGVWQVRRQAAHTLLNLAAQRVAMSDVPTIVNNSSSGSAAAPSPPPHRHPFLPALLCFPDVIPCFVRLLEAPDLEMVHVGLSFLEIVLHAWRPPRGGRVAQLVQERSARMPPPPQLRLAGALAASGVCGQAPALDWLWLQPPGGGSATASGLQLVREAGGPDALEALHYRYQMSDDGAAADLGRRARDVIDSFFEGEDEEEDEDDEDGHEEDEDDGEGIASGGPNVFASGGSGGGATFSFGAPALGGAGTASSFTAPGAFSFGPASFTASPAPAPAPATSLPPAGRGRGAIMPAWMISSAGAAGAGSPGKPM